MKYVLAGGVSGNLRMAFSEIIRGGYIKYCNAAIITNHQLLAGSGYNRIDKMKLALSSIFNRQDVRGSLINKNLNIDFSLLNILESFYYLRVMPEFMPLIKQFGFFLLDSGAFTFMGKKGTADWDMYIKEYAEFINKYDIKLFFELDIDSIVGLDKVEKYRERLESLTGKKPIPVWHKNRGKQYFIDMCKSYPYVAVGGIVTREIPRKKYEAAFPWFIKTAHENNAKIHGLGYSSLEGLRKYHFDSVDSTTWLSGNLSGKIFAFNGKGGMNIYEKKDGQRLKSKEAAINNFVEWVKFSMYADLKY